jgi:hypothetical protein
MIHKAKSLAPDEKAAIERLLGRAVADDEQISVRTVPPPAPLSWLKESWDSAERRDVDRLSMEDIDAEITAARKERREHLGLR